MHPVPYVWAHARPGVVRTRTRVYDSGRVKDGRACCCRPDPVGHIDYAVA